MVGKINFCGPLYLPINKDKKNLTQNFIFGKYSHNLSILLHFIIVIRNGNASCIFDIFLELETSRLVIQRIHQNKNGNFCEELFSENDFEAVFATFCCYDYGVNASEAVQKIATDFKDYHKCSSCVIVC